MVVFIRSNIAIIDKISRDFFRRNRPFARKRKRRFASDESRALRAIDQFVVCGIIAFQQVGFGPAFALTYLLNALSVAAGEAVACYGLGLLLLRGLEKKRPI